MPWTTVRDNVRLPLKLAHVPMAARKRASIRRSRKSGFPNLQTAILANCPAA